MYCLEQQLDGSSSISNSRSQLKYRDFHLDPIKYSTDVRSVNFPVDGHQYLFRYKTIFLVGPLYIFFYNF